ncbi:MAG: hypothetical protein LH480_11985, partial [Rubrivivax sp.]|nr:hypothetical protein [Rubrivivax sp.]
MRSAFKVSSSGSPGPAPTSAHRGWLRCLRPALRVAPVASDDEPEDDPDDKPDNAPDDEPDDGGNAKPAAKGTPAPDARPCAVTPTAPALRRGWPAPPRRR